MKPELVEPGHTAVLTMEMQRGVVGDLSTMDSLVAEVAAAGTIDQAARLAAAARGAGVRVVHCTAEFRPDLAGTALNSPLICVASIFAISSFSSPRPLCLCVKLSFFSP